MQKVGPRNPFAVTEDRAKPATEKQVRALEKRLGAPLPADYRTFLRTVNGGKRGGGWRLPGHDMDVTRFLGVRDDVDNLARRVEEVRAGANGADRFPPDTIPIALELSGEDVLIKYRGAGAGSVYHLDDTPKPRKRRWRTGDPPIDDDVWVKVAPSFGAFVKLLWQVPDAPGQRQLRQILERDDVVSVRRYLSAFPADALDARDKATGQTLLERAAATGAVKTVGLLLDRGAKQVSGLGVANARGHAKVVDRFLKHGYRPTEYDWLGAQQAGSKPQLLATYLKHAPKPPSSLVRQMLTGSRTRLATEPTSDRRTIIRMLERWLADHADDTKKGSVRKV